MSERFPRPAGGPLLRRRELIRAAGASLVLLVSPVGRAFAAGISVLAVRVWPAADYTRVAIESRLPLKYSHFTVKNPERLVVDMEGVEFDSVLESLSTKVSPDDPNIKLLRAGRFKPGIVRLVMELKQEVKPQVFVLPPVGEYGHRLVLDVYPLEPPDPLAQLIGKVDAQAQGAGPAAPATERPSVAESETRVERPRGGKPVVDRLVTIMLDPGHGGEDPGAVGRSGSYEKHITLAIAKRLKAKIDAEPNMRAVLTRDTDFFVPLQMRVQKARRIQADLFVSIHADAFTRPDANGSSVFAVLDEIGGINRLHKPQVEQAGFAVLKAPDIPSILVETAFISNPEEERRLNDDAYQNKMAEAIIAGIRKYFAKNPPLAKSRLAKVF